MVSYGLDNALPFDGDPDPTLPWADDDDSLLVPGSLLLVEPAHSASPIAGVPATGADMPNIAWKRFRDVLGAAVFTARIDNGSAGNAGNVMTVTAIAAGAIVVGQTLNGANMPAADTYFVASQVSGTPGREGVYAIGYTAAGINVAVGTITATAGDAGNLSNTFVVNSDSASLFMRERTPKGGLHLAISQTNDNVSGAWQGIDSKARLKNYIFANLAHAYYVSTWESVTRPGVGSSAFPPQQAICDITTSTGRFVTVWTQQDGTGYTFLPQAGTSQRIGFFDSQAANPNTVGTRLRAIGVNGATSAVAFSNIAVKPFVVGHTDAFASASTYGNKSASRVLYRTYIEDLTVSGRSYAQVQALDYAAWRDAFGAGGRYAGDTFTPPAV
ncbi:hypothetical protein [Sphingomonas sp. NFR15]|uniref:hypothetical protein n=1 Tax=Sphingomonas sp. NFR15 TaxID=1566282 RepID=UPI0008903FEB|nr:hypothetical protein [Sphingomonas sp. NFR15]SDA14897.1 hypothetical protein SAMN03159340_00610 [Sphingomonas sp. NFR15]